MEYDYQKIAINAIITAIIAIDYPLLHLLPLKGGGYDFWTTAPCVLRIPFLAGDVHRDRYYHVFRHGQTR